MKPLIAHLINMTKANSVAGTLKSNADVIGGLHFSPTRPRLGGRLLYSESLQTQQNGWKNKRERKKKAGIANILMSAKISVPFGSASGQNNVYCC